MTNIFEAAKDLKLYKALIRTLGEYADKFPATGVDKVANKAMERGISVIPKDKQSLAILNSIIGDKSLSSAAKVQKLMNARFADLPVGIQPIYKRINRKLVAFWSVDGKLYDKVFKLLNIDGGPAGFWADLDAKRVSLVDLTKDNDGGK